MPDVPDSPEAYINLLPGDRRDALAALRRVLKENLPAGFAETMGYGMIGYVVPHALYPAGYHCDPQLPLPFISIASQKNFIAVYHMGLYADQELLGWFVQEYPKHCQSRLYMGKSCIRFRKPAHIPYKLIGELAAKMTPRAWMALYERQLKK
ncbi:DUF1801 domain-containing protein [Pontibacter saemangeumensis]|uniref:DUF1801 domain-containing protein n=1 Tax=Pontibacter saemangeumensis TaxID=1084525 RepID=A0ABP8LT14_9BACT